MRPLQIALLCQFIRSRHDSVHIPGAVGAPKLDGLSLVPEADVYVIH